MIPTFLKPNQTYSMVSLYGVNKVKKNERSVKQV